MDSQPKRFRVWLVVGAAAVGAAIGGAAIAGAATGGSSTSTIAATSPSGTATDPAPDPAAMKQGPGETLLTGATAEKVKAAALAALPGSTIIRVETDSAGSPYEAHVTKADGTQATLKIDSDFKVTATEQGFGGGPGGAHGPRGDAAGSGPTA